MKLSSLFGKETDTPAQEQITRNILQRSAKGEVDLRKNRRI